MDRILKQLFFPKKPENSLITVEIHKNNLLHNISEFQKLNGSIAPVLKSNAYGHGLLEVARVLETASVPFFVVDSYFEAHTLRYNNIKKPILIIGYTDPKTIKTNTLKDVSFVLTSLDTLKELRNCKNQTSLHVKIDTGMRRQGVLTEEMSEVISIFKNNQYISFDGLCTHFSDADGADTSFTKKQIKIWNKNVEHVKDEFPLIAFIHISNTAGHVYLNSAQSNVSRLGIGLYGLGSGGKVDLLVNLKPVMSVKTIITGVKKLHKGETTGYGNTFEAKKDMTIATIPFGYFEGMDRRLSGRGCVNVQNLPAPIIGRVSMNITTIDVSKIKDIHIGDEVEVISLNSKDKNSIDSIARICKTISYVISVHIERGLKRVMK
jgi:alanine racemase